MIVNAPPGAALYQSQGGFCHVCHGDAESPVPRVRRSPFALVAEPFLQQPGLTFAEVLPAETIERAFAENDALFGQDHTFSTPIVLWAFLAQVLRDGKGAACAAAVADIATYRQHVGLPVPWGDTWDYCRARAKLNRAALRHLVGQAAEELEREADP